MARRLCLGAAADRGSGLRLHQEDLPASSCGRLRNLWCRERLCRMEFFQPLEAALSCRSVKYTTLEISQS